jgi:carboxypeptidase C (cathepsin A)
MRLRTVPLFACLLAGTGLIHAQEPAPSQETPGRRGEATQRSEEGTPRPTASPREPAFVPVEKLVQTQHVARVGGTEVRYTATAGTLVLKNATTGKARASMFFVAYTRDGQTDARTRPVTFAYNGGPGSASVWLHMGLVGPKRVQMAEEGFQPAPPYELVDNEESLIDVSDVVAIDAIDTGYSRAVDAEEGRALHGVRPDIEAFSDFIRLYLTRFNRWSSPKYLLGESYGTVRSAGLAADLQARHGIELSGVVLISSVLDFMTLNAAPSNDLGFSGFLPTYTATAWFHKRLPAELQGDLKKAVDEARSFAWGEYMLALAKGSRLGDSERRTVAQKVARLTGLSADFVERANLRVNPARFRKELLRERRLAVGRLDGRFTSMDADAAGEQQEFDPSNTAIQGPYTALFSDYVRRELKWESDLPYYTSGDVRPWNYGDYQNRYLNLVDNLRTAMSRNPYLRVMVANGYYDMATPFAATEYTFDHLGFEPTYRERVRLTYYEAGHMMYIRPAMLRQLKRDVAQFIKTTSEKGAPVTSTASAR